MIDHLTTRLLFRMLDIFLKVLAWGSAPRSYSASRRWSGFKKKAEDLYRNSEAYITGWSWYLTSKKKGPSAPSSLDHSPVLSAEEDLLQLSPKLLVKALAKTPLVELLQIFSDCEPEERNHLLNALRDGKILGSESSSEGSLPFQATPCSEPSPGGRLSSRGATVKDETYVSRSKGPGREPWYHEEATDIQPGGWADGIEPPFLSDDKMPPGTDQVGLTLSVSPPVSHTDSESDSESGMGIDSLAFLRWVDCETELETRRDQTDPPLFPLVEEDGPTLLGDEMAAISLPLMGSQETPTGIGVTPQNQALKRSTEEDNEGAHRRPSREDPPPRQLRSLPSVGIPPTLQTPRVHEVDDSWSTFQPLFENRKAPRSPYLEGVRVSPHGAFSPSFTSGFREKLSPHPHECEKPRPSSRLKSKSVSMESARRRRDLSLPCSPPITSYPSGLAHASGSPPVPLPQKRASLETSILRMGSTYRKEYGSFWN